MAASMAVEHGGRTTRTVGRVLIHIAMLSTASGWKLTPDEEEAGFSPDAPMITGGVSGARDRRRLASNCDSDCDDSCDTGCDEHCDWFGHSCDNSCDENCDDGCDGSCNAGCSACSSGNYGAAEQVICGPRAVAQPPNTHTPRLVHHASSSTPLIPAPQAPRSATAMV